jgi:hypothetical protein
MYDPLELILDAREPLIPERDDKLDILGNLELIED